MFLVLAKTKAEPIPKIVVNNRYIRAAWVSNFQTKKVIGTWTSPQARELKILAVHSPPKACQTLLKI